LFDQASGFCASAFLGQSFLGSFCKISSLQTRHLIVVILVFQFYQTFGNLSHLDYFTGLAVTFSLQAGVCCWLTKKGEREDLVFSSVYFFLSMSSIATPTIAIAATMMPIPGSKYMSAAFEGACVGATVGSGASSTPKAAAADELQ